MGMLTSKFTQRGFTIVELVITITVIGILAAIIVVSYNGIQQHAIETGVDSDINTAKTALESYRQANNTYPTSQSAASGVIPLTTGNTLEYAYDYSTLSYYLTVTNGSYVKCFTSYTAANDYCAVPVVTDGLIAWWPLNGDAADDALVSGNDGTLAGGVSAVAGANGMPNGALAFDGVDGEVDFGSILDSELTVPVSVSFWIYDNASGVEQRIFGSDFTLYYYGIRISVKSADDGINLLYGNGVSYASTNRRSFNATDPINIGGWTHVVATVTDATTGTMYYDGSPVTVSYSGSASGYLSSAAYSAKMGTTYSSTSVLYGNIALDDFRIYNRVLSASEAAELYDAGPQ